jgi:uncharacterized protein (DUF488 family)
LLQAGSELDSGERVTKNQIFTVGHSTHSLEVFASLLRLHGIEAIADVRSSPYSKRLPQFSREQLFESLCAIKVRYVYLGELLGARRSEASCFVGDQANYSKISQLPNFIDGLDRLEAGARKMRIALMCAEKDPLTCHRTILVSRHLQLRGLDIFHVLDNGELEPHPDAEHRLMLEEGFTPGQLDMFGNPDGGDTLLFAYEKRGNKIAYRRGDSDEHHD